MAAPEETARDDARSELHGHFAARCLRQLIRHELTEGGDGEDVRGYRGPEEGERRVRQMQDPQMRCPADGGGCRHRAKPGDHADEQRENVESHDVLRPTRECVIR